jgi:hypothetical protein
MAPITPLFSWNASAGDLVDEAWSWKTQRSLMSPDPLAPEYKEADQRTAGEPVVPAVRARAGVTGDHVRYVLAFSLAAVVVAFLIVYLIYFGGH